MELPTAGAGSQDEVVVEGRDAAHVEDENVAALVFGRHTGTEECVFQGDAGPRAGRLASHGRELQRTSFRV
jgi:hypothetical protein